MKITKDIAIAYRANNKLELPSMGTHAQKVVPIGLAYTGIRLSLLNER